MSHSPLRIADPSSKSPSVEASNSGYTTPHRNTARKTMPNIHGQRTNDSKASTSGAKTHRNTARKTMPKTRALRIKGEENVRSSGDFRDFPRKPTTDEDELMPPPSFQGVKRPLSRNSPQISEKKNSENSSQGEPDDRESLPSSQASTSTYSIPPPQLNTEAKLEWLLPRRMVGTWVQCDRCKKWRYFKDIHDPTVFPKLWYCHMNPDSERNRCQIEEQRILSKDRPLIIQNEYAPVWAKCDGFPWWPAIVDDDPDYFQFYWIENEATRKPTEYHVVFLFFFDKNAARDWVTTENIKSFNERQPAGRTLKGRLQAVVKEAEKAAAMPQEGHVRKYGMLARFRGKLRDFVSSQLGKCTIQHPRRNTGNRAASSSDSDSSKTMFGRRAGSSQTGSSLSEVF